MRRQADFGHKWTVNLITFTLIIIKAECVELSHKVSHFLFNMRYSVIYVQL